MTVPFLTFHTGYVPGVIGRITEMHADLYSRSHGFGLPFESRVATELSAFLKRYDPELDFLRTVSRGERIEGSIVVDGGETANGTAHLRWFILSPELRGSGLGKRLLDDAVAFCRGRQFHRIHLWTLAGLEPAGTLYRRHGFMIAESLVGTQWGKPIDELRMELDLSTGAKG